jgi:hypothetical protein
MPDFSISDSLGNPLTLSSVNWTSVSSIFNYAKTETLHLTVLDDFKQRKDQPLTQAAEDPLTFSLSLQHAFQLGSTTPEVTFTPASKVTLSINAKAGSDLFDDDSFPLPAYVPEKTAYVGLSLAGSVDVGVNQTSGDLCFGVDQSSGITVQYLKAFPADRSDPTLLTATQAMLSGFVIPATVADWQRLNVNDLCAISGEGCLTVSAGVDVSLPLNPLASVNLPLSTGMLTVQAGVMTGLSASVNLRGSYQIRVEKLPGEIIRLSFLKASGTTFTTEITASAGVAVNLGDTDLLAKLLGTIEKGAADPKLLAGLQSEEVDAFTSEVKAGVNHSVQASLDFALSSETDRQTAFQYEIQAGLLTSESTQVLNQALKGNLVPLTALEQNAQADGTLAPGIKLLNSVLSTARTKGATLRINLLGIVNLISLSQLINKCEFLFEPAAGLTIKETAQSEKISAITDPFKKQDALQRALFYSALATTTYVVSKTVTMPDLNCQAVYFAFNRNTSKQNISDYLNWFAALHLMAPAEPAQILNQLKAGGGAACSVRTTLNDALCEAMFFDTQGNPRPSSDYLEIGRNALIRLLDPRSGDIERLRSQFLSDPAAWAKALETGPGPQLDTTLLLASTDPRFPVLSADIRGDVADILWWADAMQNAARSLHQIRVFLAGRDTASLAADPAFTKLRNDLQKQMLYVAGKSKVRFDKPWGVVCLFLAAGSRGASGEIEAESITIERPAAQSAAITGR